MKPLEPWEITLCGTHLIEASAGTGKTYAITNLYLRLLLERGWSVGEILVVTYTRAATSELRDRIRARLLSAQKIVRKMQANSANGCSHARGLSSEDALLVGLLRNRQQQGHADADARVLALALRSFDQAAIFTIHSFCQRVLQDSAFESGVPFDTEFVTDQAGLIREIGEDFWAHQMYEASTDWVRYLQTCKSPLRAEDLVALAQQAIRTASLPVLPAVFGPTDRAAMAMQPEARPSEALQPEAVLASYRHRRSVAASIWERDRDAIVQLLCKSPALNRAQYKVASISEVWAGQMSAALQPQSVGIPASFKSFEKFTPPALLKGTKKKQQPPEHEFFQACEQLLEASETLGSLRLSLELQAVHYAREQLRVRKQALGLQSFDDLLHSLSVALDGPSGNELASAIVRRYPGVLIDEFQDTDPVQYRVFSRVYRGAATATALYLIGDPKQAIYAFRGADIFAYMQARRDAGKQCHTLDTNWRSDPSMIQAVNCLFERAPSPFVFEEIAFHPVAHSPGAEDRMGGSLGGRSALEIVFIARAQGAKKPKALSKGVGEKLIAEEVALDIAALLAGGAKLCNKPVVPGDIAVLVRSNAQALQVKGQLSQVGVPSVIDGDASVFDSPEAVELSQLLAAVAAPANSRAVVAALSTSLLGLTGNAIAELRADEARFDEWLQKFRGWSVTWQQRGFIQAYRQLLGDEGVAEGILSREGGGRRLTNFYHLGELLEAQSVTEKLGPEALMTWFGRMQSDSVARSQSVGDTGQIRLETDSDAVQLVTIHKSKGLEYPMVYCPFLWNGAGLHKSEKNRVAFHDPEDDHCYKWDIGSEHLDEHRLLAERETLAEALRLLYVAVTRAKHHCRLYWGAFNQAENSSLGRLLHFPDRPRTSPEGLEQWASHIKDLSDDQMRADLHSLAAASQGAIAVREFEPKQACQYVPPLGPEVNLQPRSVVRTLGWTSRLSSFSALTSSEGQSTEGDAHDVDRLAAEPNQGAQLSAVPQPVPSSQPEPEVALSNFPRGAQVGVMLHEIFEKAAFKNATPESLQPGVDAAMERFGIDLQLKETLVAAVYEILQTPLSSPRVSGTEVRLAELEAAQRIDEMEFLFPVSSQPSSPELATLQPRQLGALLGKYANPPWKPDYPQKVANLGFAPLSGYLRGFIDLVFCHEGRYYVVDYKSNHLGSGGSDYGEEQLQAAMSEGHYYLQSLIYLVALHRHLQMRLTNYRYDDHIGGIYYLFLRGMALNNPVGQGVYGDRPPEHFVQALSQLFEGQQWAGRRTGASEVHSV